MSTITFGFGEVNKTPSQTVRSLFILGERMTGKTHLACDLPDSILIDLSGHASNYASKARIWNLKNELEKSNKALIEAGEKPLNEYNYLLAYSDFLSKLDKKPPFLIIDSTTEFQDICLWKANLLYKATKEGASYTGNDVLADLGYGAGAKFIKNAAMPIFLNFLAASSECTIFLGHLITKNKMEDKVLKEITDADISANLKKLIAGKVWGTAILSRKDNGYQNTLSFQNNGDTDIAGGRADHLRGAKIEISEIVDEDDNPSIFGNRIITHWDLVFPEFFKKQKKSKQ